MAKRTRVIGLTEKTWERYQEGIVALESGISYPLGNDRFELDHGSDYFAFFKRLGEVRYYAALDGERVVAVGAGVLRRVALAVGQSPTKVWYGCDVKVHKDYRGGRIPAQMFVKAFPINYLRCPRGYGISMNPGDGSPNRAALGFQKLPFIPIQAETIIGLVSLDAEQMRRVQPTLEKHRGPVSYLSLAGIKDIVLESTGAPLPLLHAQFGPCAQPDIPHPQDGSTHMFCAPLGDPLLRELETFGITPSSTATIVEHRMGQSDWRFILTSDI